jgi:hypothetical protein
MSKKLVAKTVIRTLVYQFLLLWTGFSVGFMLNPEYWGNRAPIVQRSMSHIFWPKEYDKNVEEFCMNIARSRIFFETSTDCPGFTDLKIIEDRMESDEWYSAKYEYRNAEGELVKVDNYTTKVNWKPWELDYPQPNQKISDSMEDFE